MKKIIYLFLCLFVGVLSADALTVSPNISCDKDEISSVSENLACSITLDISGGDVKTMSVSINLINAKINMSGTRYTIATGWEGNLSSDYKSYIFTSTVSSNEGTGIPLGTFNLVTTRKDDVTFTISNITITDTNSNEITLDDITKIIPVTESTTTDTTTTTDDNTSATDEVDTGDVGNPIYSDGDEEVNPDSKDGNSGGTTSSNNPSTGVTLPIISLSIVAIISLIVIIISRKNNRFYRL